MEQAARFIPGKAGMNLDAAVSLRGHSKAIFFISAYCSNNNLWFYWTNSDGTDIRELPVSVEYAANSSINDVTWSPDNRFVAVSLVSLYTTDLYIFDVSEALKDPSINPLQIKLGELSSNYNISWRNTGLEKKATPEPPMTVQEAEALAGFDVLEPSYTPEGYTFQGGSYVPQTQKIILKYVSSAEYYGGSGEILIYQQNGSFPKESNNLPTHATPVAVGNVTGEFTHGAWVYDSPETKTPRWEDSDTLSSLVWQKEGITFAIDFLGGEGIPPVSINELVAIAESME